MVLVHAVREDSVAFASDLVVFMAAIGIEKQWRIEWNDKK